MKTRHTEKKTRPRIISKDDFLRLFSKSDEEMKKVLLLASLGLRSGEISALKYKDISQSAISINKTMILEFNEWIYSMVREDRTVILPSNIVDLIGQGDPDECIISINPNIIRARFRKLCEHLNMHYSFRDVRHSEIIL